MDYIQELNRAGYKVKQLTSTCTGHKAYIIGTSIEDAVPVVEFYLEDFYNEVSAAGKLPQVGKMVTGME